MSFATYLGSLFDPTDQGNVSADAANLGNAVAPGASYWNPANFGQAGQAVVSGGNQILNHNVSSDFTPMQAFQAGLSGLGQQAGTMYQHGGPEAAAALANAEANTANAGGGLGGLKTLAAQSAANTGKVGSIDTAERGQFANEATQNTAAAAASKLQQTIIQAALNHANRSKNTQAQAIIAQEAIDQQNIANSLQAGANGAQNSVAMGGIQNQTNQQALGVAAASGLLAAGGGAAVLGTNATTTPAISNPTLTGDSQSVNYASAPIEDLPGNQADSANMPDQEEKMASAPAMTPYGQAVETPEDAWYANLTKAQAQDAAAYQIYGA